MYDRNVEDPNTGEVRELTFGVSGKLVMNVLVMFDRQTGTFWSQLLGKAIEGELVNGQLTPLAASQTTWGEWSKQFPDTKALVTNGRGRYGDSYDSYYSSRSAGVLGEAREDDRLAVKELISGIVLDGQPVAYPHELLGQELVVNDEIDGTALTVWFEPNSATARLFERTVTTESGDTQLLTFRPSDDDDDLRFVDEETGSTWLLFNGRAVEGPLKGATLTAIPSTSSFWFGWKDWYPETIVYGS